MERHCEFKDFIKNILIIIYLKTRLFKKTVYSFKNIHSISDICKSLFFGFIFSAKYFPLIENQKIFLQNNVANILEFINKLWKPFKGKIEIKLINQTIISKKNLELSKIKLIFIPIVISSTKSVQK